MAYLRRFQIFYLVGCGELAHPDPNRKGGPGLENNSNLFPVDVRITKAWDSRDELRDMRVRRREGDRTRPRWEKKSGGSEGQTNEPQSKTGVDPHPTRGFDGRMNPILPPLQPNWTNLLTHVFIYIEKATPEGETHTHSWNRSLAANSSELRPVLRERALGIAFLCPVGVNNSFFILYFFIFFNLFSISVCLLNSPIHSLQLRARSQILLASH